MALRYAQTPHGQPPSSEVGICDLSSSGRIPVARADASLLMNVSRTLVIWRRGFDSL